MRKAQRSITLITVTYVSSVESATSRMKRLGRVKRLRCDSDLYIEPSRKICTVLKLVNRLLVESSIELVRLGIRVVIFEGRLPSRGEPMFWRISRLRGFVVVDIVLLVFRS